jgi:ABC-type branched-subunit amino acid transport system ATPase component
MTAAGLEIAELTITFGGVVAVSSVSLDAPMGTITGLIGPNGAGKTTTFAGCTGLVRPARGTVRLFGKDITKASPAQRARAGLGRTFQRVEVCESMSVRDNVLVGAEARVAGANPVRHLGLGGRSSTTDRVADALERCGIAHLASQPVRALSTGQKRLVELARVLAADFRFLLLDEPSSGLDDTETERFGDILRHVVDELGVGILLVEHDMELVMGVCSRLHVLEFGNLIFSGTPAETRASELVRAAYLGADADAAVGTA